MSNDQVIQNAENMYYGGELQVKKLIYKSSVVIPNDLIFFHLY